MQIDNLLQEILLEDSQYLQAIRELNKSSVTAPYPVALMQDSLLYNPVLLNNFSSNDQKILLKHELLHYVYKHCSRKTNKDSKLWNLACDLSVNSFLPKSPTLPLVYPEDLQLFPGHSADYYYYQLLNQDITIDTPNHEHWKQSPNDLPEIPAWNLKLLSVLRSYSGKKYTHKKPSRRFSTGLGKIRNKNRLLIAIDASASVGEQALKQFENIVKDININYTTTIVKFSDRILDKHQKIDLNCNATLVNPVLAMSNHFNSCIIFTDGSCDDPILHKPKCSVVWVYCSNTKPICDWGQHIWLN